MNESASVKLSVTKKEGPVFLSDLAQLDRHLQSGSKRKIIVGGQLMMVALDTLKAQAGFVPQLPRAITGGFFAKPRSTKKLNLMLDKEALDRMVKARKKPSFAIDALIRYGFKLKIGEDHCVIGAISAGAGTQVLVLTFRKQELVSYSEYQLASPSHNTYDADLHILLERLYQANSGAVFHWCGPVLPPKVNSFKKADESVWANAPSQTLSVSGQPSMFRKHGISLALAASALAAYFGASYPAYRAYEGARQELKVESASLKGETAFSAERLSVLRSRQAFFENQKRTEQRFDKFVEVLAAFAQQPGITIRSALMFQSKEAAAAIRTGKSTEFEIIVEVPKSTEDISALDQGRGLLQSLSTRTGGDLRLAATSDSYLEGNATKGASIRTYKIQGDFKNAN